MALGKQLTPLLQTQKSKPHIITELQRFLVVKLPLVPKPQFVVTLPQTLLLLLMNTARLVLQALLVNPHMKSQSMKDSSVTKQLGLQV
ncbi:hypothetical protein D3C86_1628540 [compost metagenome]